MAEEKMAVLVTGGNTGLGFAIAEALYQCPVPYSIIIGSRDISKGEAAITSLKEAIPQSSSTLAVLKIDLSSDETLKKAVHDIQVKFGRLDVLVNNAGANFDADIDTGKKSIREAWNATWDINVSGTQVLTTLAIPLLLKSKDPRLMFITSGTSTLTGTESTATPALARVNASPPEGWPKEKSQDPITASITMYRSAKTGLNMAMREWHRILRNDGVKVWCISPGFLATGFGGVGAEVLKKMGGLDPLEGGKFVRDVIQGVRDKDIGKVIRVDDVQPW